MAQAFESTFLQDGVTVRLIDKPLIGASRTIPVREWSKRVNKVLSKAATAALDAEANGEAEVEGDTLKLFNTAAVALPGAIAAALGMPPQASVRLVMRLNGTIGQPDASCAASWQNAGDTRPIYPERNGILLRWGKQSGRVDERLYAVIEAVDRFNASEGQDIESRAPHWSALKSTLGKISPELAEADEYTRRLDIMQAGAFGLDVNADPNRLDFQPILMRKEVATTLEDNTAATEFEGVEDQPASPRFSTDGNIDAEETNLLLPEDQRAFLRAFREAGQTRAAYQLRRSTYVLIDPDVRKSLDVVKRMRGASETEKRDFIRNPRTMIAEALGKEGGDPGVAALFVQTTQYSERVTGLGIWEKPKLPWLSRFKTIWLPENFPVEVDGKAFTTSVPELLELEFNIETAEKNGKTEIEFQGQTISVAQARQVIARADEEIGKLVEQSGGPKPQPQSEQGSDRLVPQVKTNLEGVDFVRGMTPRHAMIPDLMPSDRVKTEPLTHQIEGYTWLANAWKAGWPGVLLADDMGLGKTFQALAFLSWLRGNREEAAKRGKKWPSSGPILIVAPTALLENWIAEAGKHLHDGALGDVAELFGNGLKRFRVSDEDRWPPGQRLDTERLKSCDWILTTYETLADNQQSFYRIPYSVVLFDEMQKIKDPSTINTSAAKAMNADFVIGLTGTPVENRIEDLWCIMDRVFDGYLGDLKSFSATYREPSEQLYIDLQNKLTKSSAKAPPIMLRRMKEDILTGLPTKSIVPYRREMPTEQAKLYADIIRKALSSDEERTGRGRQLAIIQQMRSVSLFPGDVHQGDFESERGIKQWVSRSARLHQTMEILNEIAKQDEKALVFIEHRDMQRRFAEAAHALFGLDHIPTIINGETPGQKRVGLVKAFEARRRKFDLMVLSPKAAGVGLTITEANHVIHLSRWWNPAVEDQCNDRVYRLGQVRDVQIHVPLAVHPVFQEKSFDVSLDQMLERKRHLSRRLLMPPESLNDASELFSQTIFQ
jgi:SNF2-related domain/Helicase conserved C-terminal domain